MTKQKISMLRNIIENQDTSMMNAMQSVNIIDN